MDDEKYIVFKRDEFFQMMGELALPPGSGAPDDTPCAPIAAKIIERAHEVALEDAVVIRTQDVFAAAGLSAYAHNIRTLLGSPALMDFGEEPATYLEHVAKFFEQVAAEAEDRLARGECKVPD